MWWGLPGAQLVHVPASQEVLLQLRHMQEDLHYILCISNLVRGAADRWQVQWFVQIRGEAGYYLIYQ